MKRHLILAAMFVVTMVAVSCGFQASTYIPNGSGSEVRAAINNAFKSVLSQHSGPTEPDNIQPFMYWVDTSTSPPTTRQRNAGNTAWGVVPTYLEVNGVTKTEGSFSYSVNTGGNFPVSEIFASSNQAKLSVSNAGNYSQIFLYNNDITVQSSGGAIYIKSSASAPANASATGVTGEIRFDTNYMYRCVATNTWKRIPISTW